MSSGTERYADEVPSGDMADNSYVSRQGAKNEPIPVQADTDAVENPIDDKVADTDAQLERDDKEAINKGNIIGQRTRGAKPRGGAYCEPGDEEGIPDDDGTSQMR